MDVLSILSNKRAGHKGLGICPQRFAAECQVHRAPVSGPGIGYVALAKVFVSKLKKQVCDFRLIPPSLVVIEHCPAPFQVVNVKFNGSRDVSCSIAANSARPLTVIAEDFIEERYTAALRQPQPQVAIFARINILAEPGAGGRKQFSAKHDGGGVKRNEVERDERIKIVAAEVQSRFDLLQVIRRARKESGLLTE